MSSAKNDREKEKDKGESAKIDGFLRYDVFPERSWRKRGMPTPKVGRPNEVRSGVQPHVRTLAFNADGTRLAVGHEQRLLRLYSTAGGVISDRATSLPSAGESPHRGNVASVAWSPTEAHTLVSGCKGVRGDSVVAVWDVRVPRAPVATFKVPGDVLHVAFHPGGRHFAAVSPRTERDVAFFYTLKDGVWMKREDVQINGEGIGGGEEQVNSLRFGNSGKSVLSVNHEGALNTWFYPVDEVVRTQPEERPAKRARTEEKEDEGEGETVEREATPEPEPEPVPDREASEAPEGEGQWEDAEAEEGEGEAKAEGEEGDKPDVEAVESDANGDGDKPAEDGDQPGDAEDKPEGEQPVEGEAGADETTDNPADAAGDGDGDTSMAEPEPEPSASPARTPAAGTPAPASAEPSRAPTRAPSPTKATQAELAATDAAAKAAATAEREAHTRLIQLERGSHKTVNVGLSLALGVDPRGRYYAVGGHDARLSLVSTTTLTATRTWDECAAPIRHAAFSADGEFLAAGGDEAVTVFDVGGGEVVARIPIMGTGNVSGLSWHPTRNVLAFCTSVKNRGVGWWHVNVE